MTGNPKPPPDALCRLVPEDSTCRPEGTLVVDLGTYAMDLCVVGQDRKTHRPHCAAKAAKLYVQQLLYRAYLPVEAPDGTVKWQWVDVKKTEIGRQEQLLRRRPLNRRGPDGCIYARVPRRIHQRRVPPNVDAAPPPP